MVGLKQTHKLFRGEKLIDFEIIDFCNVAYIFNATIFSANTRLCYYSKIHGTANTWGGEKSKKKKKGCIYST